MQQQQVKIVQDIFKSIAPELWWLFAQSLMTIIICVALFSIIKQIVSYMFVRIDKELSKNVWVVLDEREGVIIDITIRSMIVLMKDTNSHIVVPIGQVFNRTWEIVRRPDKCQTK